MIEKKKSINFDNNLYNASLICEGRFCNNREFSRIYSFATENVSGYIDYFNFNDKSLLTVGSSGDQILNAFYNGARDITLFDINEFPNYYNKEYGLKQFEIFLKSKLNKFNY